MREAFRRLRRGDVDAILLDDASLGGSGFADIERVCEFTPAVPVILLVSDDRPVAAEAIRRGAQDVLLREDLTPRRLATAVACGIEPQRRLVRLRELSLSDLLTGLYNRRGFRMIAEAHLRLLRRTQRQSLLLYADVDRLKQINDAHGHAAGDQALRLCAEALRRSMRASDLVSRHGGDEFVALALDVAPGTELALLPRLETALSSLAGRARVPFQITVSVGTATFDQRGQSLDEALARADRALYREKRRRPMARPLIRGAA
jgi:diguanylate cyclase (GGDEF)-like protein